MNIDVDGTWFNTETMQEASDNKVERINIPDNLRPNMSAFYFRFDVKRHELVFEHYVEGRRFTHNSAEVFFQRLFGEKKIVREFGDVKVSIIQSIGSVDRIFTIPRITDLEIYIERPNSDIWDGDFEELAERHLEDKNARSMRVTYKAERGRGIQRDKDLDALVRTSLRNGRTVAKGYGPNGHETVTTDTYPKVAQGKFDNDVVSNNQMFEDLANRFRRQ